MKTLEPNVETSMEQRCWKLMEELDRLATAEQAQRLDMHRYLVTHTKDFGLWLDEVHWVLVDQDMPIPLRLYNEFIQLGILMQIDPDHWQQIRVIEEE